MYYFGGLLTKRRRQLLGGKFVEVSSEEMGMDGWMFRVEELQVEGRYSIAGGSMGKFCLFAQNRVQPRYVGCRRLVDHRGRDREESKPKSKTRTDPSVATIGRAESVTWPQTLEHSLKKSLGPRLSLG